MQKSNWYQLVLQQIQKHGTAFMAVALMAYIFYTQGQISNEKSDACNEQLIEVYKESQERMILVIEHNSFALDRLSEKLENIESQNN